jgi:hypothetical protein
LIEPVAPAADPMLISLYNNLGGGKPFSLLHPISLLVAAPKFVVSTSSALTRNCHSSMYFSVAWALPQTADGATDTLRYA